jgi:hypothetical protein
MPCYWIKEGFKLEKIDTEERRSRMDVKVYDAVKIPEKEWDDTPPEQRGYVEQYRKDGFVYGINEDRVEEEEVNYDKR